MSQYYIDTASGRRGPYPAQQIIDGVKQGRIPTGAVLRDAATGATLRAVDLTAQQTPAESGGHTPAQPQGASPQFMPRQAAPAQRQAPTGPAYPPPRQPQYPQQQYPPQQYGAYPGQYPPPGGYQPYGVQQQMYYPYQAPTSGWAIASLCLSLGSLLVCTLLSIAGIVCGIVALKECQPNGPKKGRGLALGGLWSGIVILVLTVAVIVLVVAMDKH